jgi:segregation and condensation protein A
MAAALAHRLQRLEAIRRSGQRLVARGQLGREFFARGSPEALFPAGRKPSAIGQGDLLQAYVRHLKRTRAVQPLKVEATDLVSVDEALAWIRRLLGQAPDWESLISYLPPGTMERLRQGELRARSALASTFVACLELAKQGSIALKQTRPFGPIYVKARATGSQRRN